MFQRYFGHVPFTTIALKIEGTVMFAYLLKHQVARSDWNTSRNKCCACVLFQLKTHLFGLFLIIYLDELNVVSYRKKCMLPVSWSSSNSKVWTHIIVTVYWTEGTSMSMLSDNNCWFVFIETWSNHLPVCLSVLTAMSHYLQSSYSCWELWNVVKK